MTSEHPDPELEGYRPVSRVAVAALLIGLAAPLALVHPMLWCVPVVGTALAVAALVRLGKSEVPMIGRKGAIFGLLISLVFVALAPTRYFTRDYWLTARAKEMGQKWLEAVGRGQTQRAYDLMIHRPPAHPSPDGKTPFDFFLEEPIVTKLLKLGDKVERAPLATSIDPEEMGMQTIMVWYLIGPPDETTHKPYIVQINAQRQIEPDGRERWMVAGVWEAS